MDGRPSCAELVAAIKPMTVRARNKHLRQYEWLDELVGIDKAAEFTGLKEAAVRAYHTQAMKDREAGNTGRWLWPKPDARFGGRRGSPTWTLRTLVLARASMPGRGRGGPAKRRTFNQGFRASVAQRVLADGLSATQAAKEAGVNVHTVRTWVQAARNAQTATDTMSSSS